MTDQDQIRTLTAYQDRGWYWVDYQVWGGEVTIAPAMYKAECDAWYSIEFSGISTRFLKVLEPVRRSANAVPAFTRVAQLKLDGLIAAGFTVSGLAIERAAPSSPHPERGFITAEGFVGWWQPDGASAAPVELPEPVTWLVERHAFSVSPHGQDAEGNSWIEEAHEPGEQGSFAVYTEQQVRALLAAAQAPAVPQGWIELTDEDRDRAFNSLPDMLDGFLKKWGWLHFAKAIEKICREKNSPQPPKEPA